MVNRTAMYNESNFEDFREVVYLLQHFKEFFFTFSSLQNYICAAILLRALLFNFFK